MRHLRGCVRLVAAALLAASASGAAWSQAAVEAGRERPEIASGYTAKQVAYGHRFMVATANAHATDAAYAMLRKGGTAVDAAIAAQMMLTLVEPQSSGIGGGAFLLHFDGKLVEAFDGRETAPAAADDKLFLRPDGQAMGFLEGVIGGRSVGAPGVLRMLELAHRQHGKLPWASLFAPAIRLAEQGFAISPRMVAVLNFVQRTLPRDAQAAAYFFDAEGKPWPAGHVLKNPALAKTLRAIAAGGADAFYRGPLARDIETKVKGHATNPGLLTAADIGAYRPRLRQAVCSDYKRWTVCGMPPPSAGGIAIAQMLGMLEARDISGMPPVQGEPAARAVHLFSEIGRLAYADRDRYIADTDFAPLPGNSPAALIDKSYLARRAALIGERSMGRAKAGEPLAASLALGMDASPDLPSTSQLSIVDGYGNALSMTSSVEFAFGSNLMVDGFILNNQLTDFSFVPVDADGPVANRVEAGKRPRSSMAPTLVFEKGSKRLVLALGSVGGPAIINDVAKVLVATLDWGLGLEQAISLPNFGSRNGPTDIERGRISATLLADLEARGHQLRDIAVPSGEQSVMRVRIQGEDMLVGAADPRREGEARGD